MILHVTVAVVCTLWSVIPVKDRKVEEIWSELFWNKAVFVVRPPALDGVCSNWRDENSQKSLSLFGVIGTAFVSGLGADLSLGVRRWLKLVSFSFSFPHAFSLYTLSLGTVRYVFCVINLNKEFRRLIAATHKLLSPAAPFGIGTPKQNKTKKKLVPFSNAESNTIPNPTTRSRLSLSGAM